MFLNIFCLLVPGVIGSLQALEAMKIITHIGGMCYQDS